MSTRFMACLANSRRMMRSVVSVFLLILVASAASARVGREDFQRFRLRISLDKNIFMRGGVDSSAGVSGLVVTVTLVNPFDDLPLSMERPSISPIGGYKFEIVPSSLEATQGSIKPLARIPNTIATFDMPQLPDITVPPGEQMSFKVDIGSWYGIDHGGKYELTCVYQEERSNTVSFEVLPIKVVNMPYFELRHRFSDVETGANAFPYMFYIVKAGRFDEVVFAYRRGRGANEHLEFHRLGHIPTGEVPYMEVNSTNRNKVTLRLPDKRYNTISHIFNIDFTRTPLLPSARLVEHAPGSPPSLDGSVVASGAWGGRVDASNTPEKALRALEQSIKKGNKLAFGRGVVADADMQRLATAFFSMATSENHFFAQFVKVHGEAALVVLMNQMQPDKQAEAAESVGKPKSLANRLFDISQIGPGTKVDNNTYTYAHGWVMRKIEGRWLLDPRDITKDMSTEMLDALIKLLDGFATIYTTNIPNVEKMDIKELSARLQRSVKLVLTPLMPMMTKLMMQNAAQDDIDDGGDDGWD